MQDRSEMTPAMAETVMGFLQEAWPLDHRNDPPRGGWDHMFSTSYQIACMALVALGQAEDAGWGASPKTEPGLPEVLPFWEDISVTVLWLARQQNMISYRKMDGSLNAPPPRVGGMVVLWSALQPAPMPNIGAGPGSGPALAALTVIPVLEALGLVQDARWTAAAETVHWRGSGGAWGLGFEADARFTRAVQEAVAMVPPARREEIDRLMRITEADVAEGVARSEAAAEEARLRWGPKALIGAASTAEQVRAMIPRLRGNALDRVFFRHWRLGRGWLEEDQASRALGIFHDRLAIAMRRAVVARLYPGGFVWD